MQKSGLQAQKQYGNTCHNSSEAPVPLSGEGLVPIFQANTSQTRGFRSLVLRLERRGGGIHGVPNSSQRVSFCFVTSWHLQDAEEGDDGRGDAHVEGRPVGGGDGDREELPTTK